MDIFSIVIFACITVFSLGLFLVSILSYKRSKNSKLLMISLVFLVFCIKGFLLSFSLFNEAFGNFVSMSYLAFFDFIVLILIFIATLKR